MTEMMTDGAFQYEEIPGGVRITGYKPANFTAADLSVPKMLAGKPVVSIGKNAFTENGMVLQSVVLPDTVKEIGAGAFEYCYLLEKLDLGNGLERLGAGFADFCGSLREITLPASLRVIEAPNRLSNMHVAVAAGGLFHTDGFALFRETALISACTLEKRTSYTVPDGTTEIGELAFAGHESLTELLLPETLTAIGAQAFRDCPLLRKAALPSSLRELGSNVFCGGGYRDRGTGLSAITVAEGNPDFYIDQETLFARRPSPSLVRYFGSGTDYEIPEGITRILAGAFQRSDLETVVFPASLEAVEEHAFSENLHLTRFTFRKDGGVIDFPDLEFRKDDISALFTGEAEHYVTLGHPVNFTPVPYKIYQYPAYDALYPTFRSLPEQTVMAVCRLRDPVALSDAQRAIYRSLLDEHFTEIVKLYAEHGDEKGLENYLSLKPGTREAVETAIEMLSHTKKTAILQQLILYKNEIFPGESFDFNL